MRERAAASFGVDVEEVIETTAELEEAFAEAPWREHPDGGKVRAGTLAEWLPEAERLSRQRHPERWARAEAAERRRVRAARPRARRGAPVRSTGSRRSASSSRTSGSDPGDGDGDDEPGSSEGDGEPAAARPPLAGPSPPVDALRFHTCGTSGRRRPGWLTFERLERLTPGLTAQWRCRVFCALPRRWSDSCWAHLEAGLDEERYG